MNYIDDMIIELNRLIKAYENYIDKHKNSKLDLIIGDLDKEKNVIRFRLFDSELIDEFELSFDKDEYKKYRYISFEVIDLLLGNNIIHNEDNILYNDIHKPYLKIIINDREILDTVKLLIVNQEKESINNMIKDMKVKPYRLFYPFKFMNQFAYRVDVSEKVLKR